MDADNTLTDAEKRTRVFFVSTAFVLLSVIIIALASFIVLNGVFGHLWYEGGVFHEGLNVVVERVGGARLAEADIPIEGIEQKVPFVEWGAWVNLALTLGVLFWYWWKNGRRLTRGLVAVFVVFALWGPMLIPVGIKAM